MSNKNNSGNQSSVPRATVVSSSNSNGDPVIVDEDTLDQALKRAKDELRRKRQEQLRVYEQELAAIKARYDKDLKSLKNQLERTEATEKISMDAVYSAAKLRRDTAHKEKLAQLQAENDREKLLHENRMQLLKRQEESEHASWVSKFGVRAAELYNERKEAEARHEAAKNDLQKKLDAEKQKIKVQYKEKEAQFKRECNESNAAHTKNLFLGVMLGSLAGFILEKSRM